MRLTYKAQDQHGKETGTVWYASTDGDSIFPKSAKEEQALKKLAAYEDAEEQGLLVRLPCKVGDAVWEFDSAGRLYKYTIDYVFLTADKMIFDTDLGIEFEASALGSSLFLTREEAEAVLERIQDEK